MQKSHKIVYGIYILVWIIMAINPKYPADWLLENVLIFILFPIIFFMDKKYNYTLLSIIFLFIFSSFHSLGAHYTYAEMEYFDVFTKFFGFQRNNFDRLVHFLFGLLVFRILFEMIMNRQINTKNTLFFTFTIIVSISTFYELFEWLVTDIFYPELGMAFLGIQGDVWDAHKDIFAAIMGAFVNILFYKSYKNLYLSKKA